MDSANVIANAQRSRWMVSQAMDKPGRQSLYSGVSQVPAVNLMEINLRRRREDNLYAFQ